MAGVCVDTFAVFYGNVGKSPSEIRVSQGVINPSPLWPTLEEGGRAPSLTPTFLSRLIYVLLHLLPSPSDQKHMRLVGREIVGIRLSAEGRSELHVSRL